MESCRPWNQDWGSGKQQSHDWGVIVKRVLTGGVAGKGESHEWDDV